MTEVIESKKKDVDCSAYQFQTAYMPELKEAEENSGKRESNNVSSYIKYKYVFAIRSEKCDLVKGTTN